MTISPHNKTLLKGTRVTSLTAITVPNYKKNKWKPHSIMRLPRKIKNADLCKKFLRLNDRKKYFYVEDFKSAGYHGVRLDWETWHGDPEIKEWCDANIGPNWCGIGPWFFFQTQQDALTFKMVWG